MALPVEMQNRPEVPIHLTTLWRCFWQASNARPVDGMGGVGGIPQTEIEALMRLHRIADRDAQLDFTDFMRALDHEYLTVKSEEYEAKQRNKAVKEATE